MSFYNQADMTSTHTVPLVRMEDFAKRNIRTAQLILVKSPDHLKVQRLYPVRRPLIIGRKESADIFLDDPKISKHHAQIYHDGKNFYIKDLNSTNGTKVNGEKVKERRISPKDVIEIGDLKFEFNYPKIVPSKVKEPSVGSRAHLRSLQFILLAGLVLAACALVFFSAARSFKKVNRASLTISSQALQTQWGETRSQIYYELASQAYGERDYQKARYHILRARELNPNDVNSEKLYGAIEQAMNLKVTYEENLEKSNQQKKIDEQFRLYMEKAQKFVAEHEWDLAVIAYQDALIISPGSEEAKQGIFNVNQFRISQVGLVREPAKAHPVSTLEIYSRINDQISQANELVKQERYLEAMDLYKKALELTKRYGLDVQTVVAPMILCAQEFKTQTTTLWADSQTLYDAQKYSEAKEKMNSLVKIYPFYRPALERQKEIQEILDKQAQALFARAHIFEAMPDIDAAKEKWQAILSLVSADHDYYKRAQKKLSQYKSY